MNVALSGMVRAAQFFCASFLPPSLAWLSCVAWLCVLSDWPSVRHIFRRMYLTYTHARALSRARTHAHTHVRMPKATVNFERWRINYLGVKISTLLFETVLSLRYDNACLGL
jgi:hypothetical protein